jgi:cytochrome b involved in lipid metabolism
MRKVTRKEVKDKNYVIMNNMVYDISQFIDEVSETKKT